MRTTIRLDDALLEEARRVAESSGKSLAELIEDALRESLARHHEEKHRVPVVLRSFRGRGLRPGVNLDDSATLLELMDQPDAAP